MIGLEPTDEQRRQYVMNIISAWQNATKDQRARGRTWYANAHTLAVMIDESNPRRGAGVIAALSANKRWADNVKLAVRAEATQVPSGHVPDVLRKVTEILAGSDPLDVLPVGKKTWHFFRCIADPSDPQSVVVDRHAHDIAVHEIYGNANRGLSTQRRYDIIVDAYRTAAELISELPSTVQAVTWVAHIERTH